MPPVVAAIGTVISSVGALTIGKIAVGKFILQVGASLVLNSVSRRLAPKPQSQATMQPQSRQVSIRQTAAPRDLVYGEVRKGGTIIYWNQYGPKKEYAHLVIVVAGHQIESIDQIYFDGVLAVDKFGVVTNKWYGFVDMIERADGQQTTNPFPVLASLVTDWTQNHIIQGCAAIAIRLNLDQRVFPNGVPSISFDIRGKNDILDPRTGSRGYSFNSALCLADFISMPSSLGGFGAAIGSDTGVNTATLIEAANICDELVPISFSLGLFNQLFNGQERRYTANGFLQLDGISRASVAESLAESMAGSAVYRGNQWYVLAGAYRTPAFTITPNDFDEKSFSIQTRRSMRENFNCVRGTFISPENDWQLDDYPAYKSAVYIAEDGGEEKWLDLPLVFTKSPHTAQRLAKIALEKMRRQISVSFSGKLPLFKATAGDTVNFSFPFFGFDQKPFDVESVEFSGDGEDGARLQLVLRETSPMVYSWTATEAQIYAAAPRTNLPDLEVDPPFNLVVSESLYSASIGQGVRARVTLSWSPSPSVNAYQYDVRFREVGQIAWRAGGIASDTFVEFSDFDSGDYEFEVRAVSRLGVFSEFASTRQVIYGLTVAPDALENFSVSSLGGIALLQWRQAQELDVLIGGDILIAHSQSGDPNWGNSTLMREVAGHVSGASVELIAGTYMIRSRDSTGNLGPVTMAYSDAATALTFSPLDFLQEDNEFSGVKSGTSAYGGALILTGNDNIWAHENIWEVPDIWTGGAVVSGGVYDFASILDFGLIKSVKLRRDVEFAGRILDDNLWAAENIWALEDIYGSDENTDVAVEISVTSDNPSASPVWSNWTPIMATEVRARAVRARAVLTTQNPRATPAVTRLRLYAEEVTA